MKYKLTAKENCHVWNTLQQHYLINKGEVVYGEIVIDKNNVKVISIVILGIPTLFDFNDAKTKFDIKEIYEA